MPTWASLPAACVPCMFVLTPTQQAEWLELSHMAIDCDPEQGQALLIGT